MPGSKRFSPIQQIDTDEGFLFCKEMLDQIPVAFTIADTQGKFIMISVTYEKLFHVKREDYLGKDCTSRTNPGEQSVHAAIQKSHKPFKAVKTMGSNGDLIWAEGVPIFIDQCFRGSFVVSNEYNKVHNTCQQMEQAKRYIQGTKMSTAKFNFQDIRCQSSGMEQVIAQAKMIAETGVTVLIRGESGTGKELFAHAIHNASNRKAHPFLSVNCAALAESLLESILFGYEGHSFTGAKKSGAIGLFESANHGTIFLDEIGDINPELQSKLLRVLQFKEILRVGSVKPVPIDVRVVAATNANLEEKVKLGRFREDLYYRLNIFPLLIPPLRERKEDIDILARHLVEQYAREYHHPINRIEAGYIEKLHSYHWPGNVRELENVIARSILKTEKTAASLSANSIETKIAVPKSPAPLPPTNSTHDYRGNYQDSFTEWEKNLIETSFSRNRKNKTDTAQELGISIRSLYDKIRKYKLQ